MSSHPPQRQVTTDAEVGRACPYCRFPFKSGVEAATCPSCAALHHAECWQDNGGCAVMGCASAASAGTGTLTAQPAPPALPPPPAPIMGGTLTPAPPTGSPTGRSGPGRVVIVAAVG